jgi:hypothetical protein
MWNGYWGFSWLRDNWKYLLIIALIIIVLGIVRNWYVSQELLREALE